MPNAKALPPEQLAPKLWLAQLSSAVLLTGLAWALPWLIPITPIEVLTQVLPWIAVAAVPLTLLVARLLGVRRRDPGVQVHTATGAKPEARKGPPLGAYIAVLGLAELPAMLAVIYVFSGGPTWHALGFGLLSVGLMLAFPPSSVAGSVTGSTDAGR